MEIIKYSQEHRIFRDSVRGFFAREVIPHIDEWEAAGIVPREMWLKMGEQGFLCMDAPEKYGGLEADFLYSVILAEELARTNHTGLAAPLHSNIVVPYVTHYGSEEVKERILPGAISGEKIGSISMTEPGAGSDLAGIRTTAVADGDEIVLNGQKTFVSNGINCDFMVVAARDPAVENPHAAMDLYVVEADRPGFVKGKKIDKVGWRSQDTAEIFLEDCRIPAGNRLGKKGGGFLMLMNQLGQERLMCCISAVASAEYLLEITTEYCKEREAFGRPIIKFQNSRFTLVEMATEIRLGRTFVDKLIVDHIEGENIVTEISMAKYWTTDMANRVADRCVQLHGGYGYCEEYPVARAWRDLRVMSIFAGTNEIMKEIVARFMGL